MKYTVIKAVQVPTGTIVTISKEQADRRGSNQLRHVKGSQHEALVPVWFKAGETVGLEEPPKHLLESLVEGSVKADKGKAEKGTVEEPVAMAEKAAKVVGANADDSQGIPSLRDINSPIQQVDRDTLPAVRVNNTRAE